jgi:hypothetical protein
MLLLIAVSRWVGVLAGMAPAQAKGPAMGGGAAEPGP